MSQLTIKTSAENQTVQEKAIAHINISSGAEIVDKDELQEGTMNTEKPPLSEKGLFYQEMIGILNEVHEKTDYSGKNVLMLQERPSLNEDVINSRQLSVQMMGNVLAVSYT
ncbi:hypothetical protein, partial [Methanosarcina mazei]|uniref:hypothetical protein n=1 Tax=Methanosarcina mazei TaxID=2209 RepID=UPI00064FBD48